MPCVYSLQKNIEDTDYNMLGGRARQRPEPFQCRVLLVFNPQLTAHKLIYVVPNPTHSTHGKIAFI